MTDNKDIKIEIANLKETDNIDSDKSFESCVNSVIDGLTNVAMKDDDSEKSFLSCSNQDKVEGDKNENLDVGEICLDNDEEDDDDIRPGSCRENPSSDEETTSSWDESKDNWIYDNEYIEQAEIVPKIISKPEITEEILQKCEQDLEYIVENHISKENKHETESKNVNNPTYIPTNGKFYMHDLRVDNSEVELLKKSTQSTKNANYNKLNEVWSHDLYDEKKQKPISKSELINKYGADIRNKNDNAEFKENRVKKHSSKASTFKNQSYNKKCYYDYEYYDDYESYYDYNYDRYYDYGYYEPQYNSWNNRSTGSSSSYNRNYNHNRNEYNKTYRSSYSPEIKPKKAPKPPSKYSQIAEYTDIKITVNLDKFGTRQIESISNNSNKRIYQSRTFENQNYRRNDAINDKQSNESSELDNYLNRKVQESELWNSTRKQFSQEQSSSKQNINNQKLSDMLPQKGYGTNRKSNNQYQSQRSYNYLTKPQQRDGNNSSQQNYSKRFSGTNNYEQREIDKPTSNRNRQNVPDWVNSKFEWDANCDFKDVIEEMPPLTEREINQLQKRPMNSYNHPPAPRFAREKPSTQFDNKSHQNRPNQPFVRKRYSELRNIHQSELSPPQPPPPPLQIPHSQPLPSTQPLQQEQPQIINYHHMIPNLEYYQPLLLNMPQGSHAAAAAANSPQQSANTFSSIHPTTFHQIIQPGVASNAAQQQQQQQQQQQFYIQPVYLPTTSNRLNHFSQSFQPSFVAQTSQATIYPAPLSSSSSTVASSANTPTAPSSSNSRPVLGRS